jgi:hypothetical protein
VNRRAFLKLFAAAGPVAAIAPTYFFAPIGGWRSDVIVNPLFPPDRMYHVDRNGIYENGIRISRTLDEILRESYKLSPKLALAKTGRSMKVVDLYGAPGAIRTPDLLVRRGFVLYGINKMTTERYR